MELQVPSHWNLLSQSFSASLLLHSSHFLLQLSHLLVLHVSLTQGKGFGTGHPTWPSQPDDGHSFEIIVTVLLGNFAPSIPAVADISTQIDPLKEEADGQTSACRSALDLCRWSQNGVQLLSCMYFKSLLLHLDHGMFPLQKGSVLLKLLCEPPWQMCCTIFPLWSWCSWLLVLSVGVRGSHHHSWPHSLTASLVQAAKSWQFLALP